MICDNVPTMIWALPPIRPVRSKGSPMKWAARAQQGVQGVEIGLRIAYALANAPGPMALRDLAAATRLAPSKVHRYLVSLCRSGMVEQDGTNGRYDLGR